MKLWKTPIAEVRWCKLLEPAPQFDEAKPNAYSCELLLPVGSKEALEFEAQLEEIFNEVHEGDAKRNQYAMPIRVDKDDDKIQVFKFKLEDRTFEAKRPGDEPRRTEAPVIMDSRQNPWDRSKLIGNGSKIIVAFNVYPWGKGRPGGVGITLQPRKVMVVDLVEYVKATDDEELFGVVEGGYVQEPVIPF
jgi:hypothetical protein